MILFIIFFSFVVTIGHSETIEALIYGDNWFAFYLNGGLVKEDPMDFTPHQAVRFTFDVDTSSSSYVYAIKVRDWANANTGYEYMESSHPGVGGGGLKVKFSDGTVSSSTWKCYVTSTGPTTESQTNGCSDSNYDACEVLSYDEPEGWTDVGYDDSHWLNAVEYTDAYTGWGRTPTYESQTGQCCCMTDPVTGEDKNPNYLSLNPDECIAPKFMDWGSASFIWTSDLYKDNEVLCRLEISKGNVKSTTSMSSSSASASFKNSPLPPPKKASSFAEIKTHNSMPLLLGVVSMALLTLAGTFSCLFPGRLSLKSSSPVVAESQSLLMDRK